MRRWLPYPYASLALLAFWLLLNQSLSAGHLLLGIVGSVLGPFLLRRLDVPAMRFQRPRAAVRLLVVFVADMVRSNLKVVRLILGPNGSRSPGFVRIPLYLRSPYGLAVLACIITATPGTCWVSHDPDEGTLVIHVLDLQDDDDWGMIIKERYGRLLREIFE